MIDFPPGIAERIQDRSTPIWITEGVKKGDAGACAGLAIVDLAGVCNWLRDGVPLPDFRDLGIKGREIIICFDSDIAVNKDVHQAARDLGEWLKIKDAAPILAVAATIVANRAAGDPVWLLVVGPPSSTKTEIISSAAGLPYIVKAATVTEAALLSGTAKREQAKDATGVLLRMVGEFGILLCKDFTSVLSQNRDVARQAMAALREVYDGSWDRPIGGDGGRVLSWAGKCGLVGGVTPSFDRYSVIVNTLGDRFILLRLPDVDAEKQATSALDRRDQDTQMRSELAAAMTGLIHAADLKTVGRDLREDEKAKLIKLATYTARARTAVERDGYTRELLVIPQAEGPARLVLGLRHLYGGLEGIGADEVTRWSVVGRVARDCVPAIRNTLIRHLVDTTTPERTSDIAQAVGMVTKTAHRELEDLALLKLVNHTKSSGAANAADMWTASDWLREFWPKPASETEMYIHAPITFKEGDEQDTNGVSVDAVDPTPSRTFLSHPAESNGDSAGNGQTVFDFESVQSDISDAACEYCGLDLNAFQIADGVTIHPDCAEVAKLEETHP
jgi:hypothetical protein